MYYEDAPTHAPQDLTNYATSFGTAMGELADEAWETNITKETIEGAKRVRASGPHSGLLYRPREEIEWISREAAAQRLTAAGVPEAVNDLGEGDVSEEWVSLQEGYAANRRRKNFLLSNTEYGAMGTAAGFAVSLGVSMGDPGNLAASFLPVMGQARYLKMLEKAGRSARARSAVRAKVGAIEGFAGASAIEPFILLAEQGKYSDYDMADSLLNLALGGVMGGGLHMGAGALKDRFKGIKLNSPETPDDVVAKQAEVSSQPTGITATKISNMTPKSREALFKTGFAQMSNGYIDMDDMIALIDADPVAREFTPQMARQAFIDEQLSIRERWYDAQDSKTAKGVAKQAAALDERVKATPERVKQRTKELQSEGMKYKDARKSASSMIADENARLRSDITRLKEDTVTEGSRVEIVGREIKQLKQGNIPQRAIPMLDRYIGAMGKSAPSTRAAMANRDRLVSIAEKAERPDHALGRDLDAHVPVKNKLDELDKYDGPEDIQRDIDDLMEENPDLNTSAFDERIGEIKNEGEAIRIVADCMVKLT